jgi:hypothetical protein
MTVEATTSATATMAHPCKDKEVKRTTQALINFMAKTY